MVKFRTVATEAIGGAADTGVVIRMVYLDLRAVFQPAAMAMILRMHHEMAQATAGMRVMLSIISASLLTDIEVVICRRLSKAHPAVRQP
jgi:hypothetical protein